VNSQDQAVPEANGRTVVKVVYTVLEAQYQSALTAAVKQINSTNKTVAFELVGYLLEELRDESNYESFKQDVASANIFIGSLIFIEELAEKVSEAVCFCCMSPCAWVAFAVSGLIHPATRIRHPAGARPCTLGYAQSCHCGAACMSLSCCGVRAACEVSWVSCACASDR